MRIAFVTQPGHAALPASGSIELWADTVAKALSRQHEVTIYASRPPSAPPPPEGDVQYRLVPHDRARPVVRGLRAAWRLSPPRKPFFASVLHPIEYWTRVARDVRRHGVDVVHVFNYSQALPVLRRLTDAKLVLHMHCEWLSQLDRSMIERRLRSADLVVGCSDYITDKVRERFPRAREPLRHDPQRGRGRPAAAAARPSTRHDRSPPERRPCIAREGPPRPGRRARARHRAAAGRPAYRARRRVPRAVGVRGSHIGRRARQATRAVLRSQLPTAAPRANVGGDGRARHVP